MLTLVKWFSFVFINLALVQQLLAQDFVRPIGYVSTDYLTASHQKGSQTVSIDAAALFNQSRGRFQCLGLDVEIVLKSQRRDGDTESRIFEVSGDRMGRVYASRRGEIVNVYFRAHGKQIRLTGSGHVLQAISEIHGPGCGGGCAHAAADNIPGPVQLVRPDFFLMNTGKTQIDVLIVYSQNALTHAGSVSAMQTEAANLITSANDAFDSSLIDIQFNLVGLRQVDTYDETGKTFSTVLYDLSRDNNIPEAITDRAALGADLVCFLGRDFSQTNVAGLAWVGTPTNNGSAGFSIVDIRYGLSNLTFAHELGHNMGCDHNNPGTGSFSGAYSYSFGHRWDSTGGSSTNRRSIMSTQDNAEQRVAFFSNPNVNESGQPTGVAIGDQFEAHNAQSLQNMRSVVAGWMLSNNVSYVVPSGGISEDLKEGIGAGYTFTVDTDVTNGTLNLNGDGTFTYMPNASFEGTDSFVAEYSGSGSTGLQTVTLDVYNNERVVWVEYLSSQLTEGQSTTAVARIYMRGDAENVTIALGFGGTATLADDFTVDKSNILFTLAGGLEQQDDVTFTVVNDTAVESAETISITIPSSSQYAIAGAVGDEISITDNDTSSGGGGGGSVGGGSSDSGGGCGLGAAALVLALLCASVLGFAPVTQNRREDD